MEGGGGGRQEKMIGKGLGREQSGREEVPLGLMGPSVVLLQPDTNVFNLTSHPVLSDASVHQAAMLRA
jgi:hypothetical protein